MYVCLFTARNRFGKPVATAFGMIDEGSTAVIEMAAASGLFLLPEAAGG